MDDAQVSELASVFVRTLSAQNANDIKQAEEFLKKAADQPSYGLTVLKLVAAEAAPLEVRQAASVNFKNHVKARWQGRPADDLGGGAVPAMPDAEKEQIKGLITSLMLSALPPVRAQLSEALTIISGHDFPSRWQGLLPELCRRLASEDAAVVNGVLHTANSILKRYRNQFMTEGLSKELEYCQQAVQPLLAALQRTTAALPAAANANDNAAQLRLRLSSARLACRVFYSLNSPGLTEDFENTLDSWMAEFHTLLTFEATLPQGADPDKENELDAAKSAVAANANLFMGMNEEEFKKYLQTFVQDIWLLLTRVSLEPRQDGLAMNAIRFLTTVAKSVHHELFRNEDVLKQVCEKIVIPNTQLREDAEELFEFNWLEYVRQDTEGSDADTRRRAASELVRALTDRFPAEVTQLFTGYVGAMLQQYAANPADWKAKDCAVYLVMALAGRVRTAAAGAKAVNELVNIADFFRTQVAPDIQSTDANLLQILRADALKFTMTFRAQIPKTDVLAAFPGIVALLGSESNVVHSQAAMCIEQLLIMKDDGQPRFTVADLQSQLQPLLSGLFGVFQIPESTENQYVMKCIARLITFIGPQIVPVASVALGELAKKLLEVCKNPMQPHFNHFLFEAVADLIHFGTAANPDMLDTFQEQLFPAFQVVLQEDVTEFHPYVFQIFAQLIELRKGTLPAVYMQLFAPLLAPQFWERPGNVTPLVRLLQAYLEKAPGEVVQGGHLEGVLGVFQKLLASRAHDHEGFFLLNSLMEFLPLDVFRGYLPTIWTLLFRRLQSAPTTKYSRGLVVFIAFFVCKHGGAMVLDSIDALQPQPPLSSMILDSVWAPTLPQIRGDPERRIAIAASGRLLAEVPRLQEAAAAPAWGRLLQAALALLAQAANGSAAPEDEVLDVEEFAGYTNAYSRLVNAHKPERDPLPEVPNAATFLAQQLGKVAASQPGALPGRITAALPAPEAQQQLQALLQSAGVAIS